MNKLTKQIASLGLTLETLIKGLPLKGKKPYTVKQVEACLAGKGTKKGLLAIEEFVSTYELLQNERLSDQLVGLGISMEFIQETILKKDGEQYSMPHLKAILKKKESKKVFNAIREYAEGVEELQVKRIKLKIDKCTNCGAHTPIPHTQICKLCLKIDNKEDNMEIQPPALHFFEEEEIIEELIGFKPGSGMAKYESTDPKYQVWAEYKKALGDCNSLKEAKDVLKSVKEKYPELIEEASTGEGEYDNYYDHVYRSFAYHFRKGNEDAKFSQARVKKAYEKYHAELRAAGVSEDVPGFVEDHEFIYQDDKSATENQLENLRVRQNFGYDDAQTHAEKMYESIRADREAQGEDIGNYYVGPKRVSTRVDYDAGESIAIEVERNKDPIEEYGILETMCRKFDDGIVTGRAFDNIAGWRNQYFDMGMKANQVHSPLFGIVTLDEEVRCEKLEELLAKTTAAELTRTQELMLYIAELEGELEEKMSRCRGRGEAEEVFSRMYFSTYKKEKQAKAEVNENIEFNRICRAIANKDYHLNRQEVTETPKKKRRVKGEKVTGDSVTGLFIDYVEHAVEMKMLEATKHRASVFPKIRVIRTIKTKGNMACYGKPKSMNSDLLGRLRSQCKAQILRMFPGLTMTERAFQTVKHELELLLIGEGDKGLAGKINRNEVEHSLTTGLCAQAIKHAEDRFAKGRFTGAEHTLLIRAGLIEKKNGKATGRVKKADLVEEQVAKLVALLKSGNIAVVTKENAQSILDAAYTGGQHRLCKEDYKYVVSIKNGSVA